MKRIEAIVNIDQLETVTQSLEDLGIRDIVVMEIQGFIRRAAKSTNLQTSQISDLFVPKCKLDASVIDEQIGQAARAIFASTKSRAIVDGKLFFDSPDLDKRQSVVGV